MQKQISPRVVSLVFGVLVLCFGITFYVIGWTEPTQSPPGCPAGQPGCDAPINVGPTGQVKIGGLALNTGADGIPSSDGATNGLLVYDGNVGIGTTSPMTDLHINDLTSGADVGLRITGDASGNSQFIQIGTTKGFAITVDGDGTRFSINYDDPLGSIVRGIMLIDASGLVEINGNLKLDLVAGGSGVCVTGGGSSDVTFSDCVSSRKYKENIKDLEKGLDIVMKLRPRTFDWKEGYYLDSAGKDDTGFISEEVDLVYPRLVKHENEEAIGVEYEKFTALLTKAIQEQQQQIEELKGELSALKQLICLNYSDIELCQ